MSQLAEGEIAAALERTPGWQRSGKAIERTYRFRDFNEAMVFVNRVAGLAERANRSPARSTAPDLGDDARPPP